MAEDRWLFFRKLFFSVNCQESERNWRKIPAVALKSANFLQQISLSRAAICLTLVLTAAFLNNAVLNVDYCWSEDPISKEYRLKVAFLFNFARFTNWPDDSEGNSPGPLKFCVLGADPLGAALDNLQSRTVRDRPIKVARFSYDGSANLADLNSCHLLFISSLDKKQFHQIEHTLNGSPVLTITDQDQQGMIDLIIKDNMVRFVIDRNKAEKAKIRISSHLLKLAMEVLE
jgi:hypothetical protein